VISDRQRLWLSTRRAQIVTLQLHGFVFFGNVVGIVQDIEQRIKVRSPPANQVVTAGTEASADKDSSSAAGAGKPARVVAQGVP
jgi:MFS superfamily sulfate permease-like transporter